MHRYNVPEAYEKLKDLTRGRVVSKESIQKFTNGLQLPEEAKNVLLNLTPQSYIGEEENLSKSIDYHVDLVNGFRLLKPLKQTLNERDENFTNEKQRSILIPLCIFIVSIFIMSKGS